MLQAEYQNVLCSSFYNHSTETKDRIYLLIFVQWWSSVWLFFTEILTDLNMSPAALPSLIRRNIFYHKTPLTAALCMWLSAQTSSVYLSAQDRALVFRDAILWLEKQCSDSHAADLSFSEIVSPFHLFCSWPMTSLEGGWCWGIRDYATCNMLIGVLGIIQHITFHHCAKIMFSCGFIRFST